MNSLLLLCLCLSFQDVRQELPAAKANSPRVEIEGMTAQVHEIGPLTGQARCEELLTELMSSRGTGDVRATLDRLNAYTTAQEKAAKRADDVLDAVKTFMLPSFAEREQRLANLGNGQLMFVGLPEQQNWLTDFLSNASLHKEVISVEARILKFPLGSLKQLELERTASTLDSSAMTELEAKMAGLQFDSLAAPRVVTNALQKASLFAGEQHAYIKDYELQVLENVEIADPVIDIVQAGIRLELLCAPLLDGRLAVDVNFTISSLEQPIRQVELSLGTGHPVTIQLPELGIVRMMSKASLRETDVAVLATEDPHGKHEYVVFFSAKRMPSAGNIQSSPEVPADR